jgi:hypothetical protein
MVSGILRGQKYEKKGRRKKNSDRNRVFAACGKTLKSDRK